MSNHEIQGQAWVADSKSFLGGVYGWIHVSWMCIWCDSTVFQTENCMIIFLKISTTAFEVLMAVNMKTVIFCDMKPCCPVDGLEHFLKTYCLYFSVYLKMKAVNSCKMLVIIHQLTLQTTYICTWRWKQQVHIKDIK
jgi:hypothetical protein